MSPTEKIIPEEMLAFAQQHGLSATEIQAWANSGEGFAEEYLRTHGKVNFATYLAIKAFMEQKKIAGTDFANWQTHTANALVQGLAKVEGAQERGAALFRQQTI